MRTPAQLKGMPKPSGILDLTYTSSGTSRPSLSSGKKLRPEQRPQKRKCEYEREIATLHSLSVAYQLNRQYYNIHLRSTPIATPSIANHLPTRHPPRMIQP